MADKTFLKLDVVSGDFSEAIGVSASAGVADADKLVATNSAGYIDPTLLPPGVAADTKIYPAFEDLTAGDFVNIFDDTGTKKVRKAIASSDRRAHGFILAGAVTAANIAVYFDTRNTSLTGIEDGVQYFLSDTTPGGFTDTPVTGTGKIHQSLGYGTGTTAISFEPGPVVVKA